LAGGVFIWVIQYLVSAGGAGGAGSGLICLSSVICWLITSCAGISESNITFPSSVEMLVLDVIWFKTALKRDNLKIIVKRQVVLCHHCFLLKTKLNSLSIPIFHYFTPTVLVLVVNWSHFQGVISTIWLHTSPVWKIRIFPSAQRCHNVELVLVLTFSQFVHGIVSEKDG
jgi:hypothetical protein